MIKLIQACYKRKTKEKTYKSLEEVEHIILVCKRTEIEKFKFLWMSHSFK